MLGWTETLSAMGGLAYAAMLGLMDILYAKESQPLDIIPVDFVSNQILSVTKYTAGCAPGTLNISHASSSKYNPVNIGRIIDVLLEWISRNPSPKQVFEPSLTAVANEKIKDALFYIKTQLPLEIMHRVAKLPKFGSKKKVEQVKNFKKLTKKMSEMQSLFFHFMNSEYIYDNDTGIRVWNMMSAEEKSEFPFDIRLVNWDICLPGF